jgi:hypothetical protein
VGKLKLNGVARELIIPNLEDPLVRYPSGQSGDFDADVEAVPVLTLREFSERERWSDVVV